MQNEAHYDLDRKAAKISALSSNNLDKYEYLTGEDLLGLRPSTVEQAKFEYSTLGKIYNNGLDKDEHKKEGLLKRLKNIEDKNEEQLNAIKNKASENIKEGTDLVDQALSLEAKDLIEEIRGTQKDVDYRKSKLRGGNNTDYDFSDYWKFKELFKNLYYKKITIEETEREQDEFDAIIGALENYTPRNDKYIEAKNKLLNNVKEFYEGREKIIEGFKNGIFPFNYDEVYEEWMRYENEEEEINNIRHKTCLIDYEKLMGKIGFKESDTNSELIKKHLFVNDLGDVLKNFKKSKTNPERNKIQVGIIKNELTDLKEEIENMSKEEEEIEKPNVIVDIAENILEFNRQQQGQGLKILTPNQMLSRLPISLAQLKARNNSEKLKNKIRQLLYSLHRSKKHTKNILVDII